MKVSSCCPKLPVKLKAWLPNISISIAFSESSTWHAANFCSRSCSTGIPWFLPEVLSHKPVERPWCLRILLPVWRGIWPARVKSATKVPKSLEILRKASVEREDHCFISRNPRRIVLNIPRTMSFRGIFAIKHGFETLCFKGKFHCYMHFCAEFTLHSTLLLCEQNKLPCTKELNWALCSIPTCSRRSLAFSHVLNSSVSRW